jgi:hypothetical protein
MKWKHPSITKIYEALGAVVDDRIEIKGNTAKVYSSSRNKFYNVTYDSKKKQIMSNDNSSYWKGDLGYPSIAFLMKIGVFSYDGALANILRGVPWKDINQKFNNDFDKALEYILSSKTDEEKLKLNDFVQKVDAEIKKLSLSLLGKKTLPPNGY